MTKQRFLALGVILGMALPTLASADEWRTRDKQLHAGASTLISAAAYQQTRSYGAAMATCIGVGLAKEIYDHQDYGTFSWKDMGANTVGCGAGLVLGRLLFGTNNGLTYRW